MKNIIILINLSIIIGITTIFTQSEEIVSENKDKVSANTLTAENVSAVASGLKKTIRSNFSRFTSNTKTKSSADETITAFITDLTEARIMDIEQGKTAEQRCTTRPLKEYGSLMIKDQAKMLNELKKLAARKNISIPSELGPEKAEALGDLRKVHGQSFDKKFIKMMIIDHKRDAKKLERAARSDDADIQVFATKYLPVVQSHLDKIKALKKSL